MGVKAVIGIIILGFIVQAAVSFIPQNVHECGIPFDPNTRQTLGPRECQTYPSEFRLGWPAHYFSYDSQRPVSATPTQSSLPKFLLNILLWHGLVVASYFGLRGIKNRPTKPTTPSRPHTGA